MKVVDIANQIWLEQGQPTDTGISSIAFWIRSNVGKLNTLLYECFYVDEVTYEILKDRSNPMEINPLAVAVIKAMYEVYRADLDVRNMLSSIDENAVISAADEGFSIKRLNKSEVLKTLVAVKKDNGQDLTDLVHYYRSYHGEPRQVSGDDIFPGIYRPYSSAFDRAY